MLFRDLSLGATFKYAGGVFRKEPPLPGEEGERFNIHSCTDGNRSGQMMDDYNIPDEDVISTSGPTMYGTGETATASHCNAEHIKRFQALNAEITAKYPPTWTYESNHIPFTGACVARLGA